MLYDTLGTTDLKVSKICLGTMTFGEQNTEAEGHAQLDYALEHGVNFIDTAEMYSIPGRKETQGSSERIIGSWFAGKKQRDKVVLATKIVGPSPRFEYIRNPLDFSPTSIRSAIETSLQRLQTDYIDLYQLHWPERVTNYFGMRGYPVRAEQKWEDNMQAVLETLDAVIKEGKVRYFGVSNETPWGLSHYLKLSERHNLPRVVSVQNPYSLLNRLYEIGMAEISIRENAGLLAYSPLGFGMLSGKYHLGTDTPDNRLNKFREYNRYSSDNCKEATARYLKIAENMGVSLTKMALAFVNQQPFLTSNIIGATNLQQLKENIESVELKLDEETLNAIDEVQAVIPNPAP